MKKRLIIFETIRHGHRPWVAWYLVKGYSVRVFDFHYHLKFMDWLRPLLHNASVERIYFHPGSRAEDLAMDAAEWLYPQCCRHPLVRCFRQMLGEEEADAVFKYALSREAACYFFMRLFLERIRETEPGVAITFVPESFLWWHRVLQPWVADRLRPMEGVEIQGWFCGAGGVLRECARWLRYLPLYGGAGFYLFVIAFARALSLRKGREGKPTQVLYAIASGFQTKFSGGRKFDFLIDHKTLTSEDVAFLTDSSAEGPWVEEARRLGYRVMCLSDYSGWKGLLRYPPAGISLRGAFRAVLEGIRRFGTPDWIHQAAVLGLRTWIKEAGFLEHFPFVHYVYASQYGLVPRWRNALIRRVESQSWYYAYSNGGAFLYQEDPAFAGGKDFGGRIRFWAYDNADHFVSPCSQLVEYYRKHRQKVRWYHKVGNIWSEQILRLKDTLDLAAVRTQWFPQLQPSQKVVAWFDTSFVEAPNSPATFAEAIQWYSDILQLADECADLFMVIKPSKDTAYYVDPGPKQQWAEPRVGKRLMQVWEKLKSHPRARFLDHHSDPTLITAASDLTVTYCFSSVSAEVLGARKRAIWYEPGERWRETLYGKEPLLTAHGYEELKRLTLKLLFEMSEQEYDHYVDTKVRGLVEDHLDGQGLTRFRSLLVHGEVFPS